MGIFGFSPVPYRGQIFDDLKKQAQESGHPFIDTEFPPDEKSLFTSGGKMAGIEWKRPKDFCQNPKLFIDGASAHDLIQGELGNCWFVAASSALATDKDIWSKVIPEHKEQEWDDEKPEKYAGIFHFCFWRYGEWIDVVIDDFLPTRNGKLVFVHSKSENEFWSALLEKAYAKLFGNYEALDGGELSEALEDFTGGVAEPIDLVEEGYHGNAEKTDELFETMKKEIEHRALMAAAIPAKSSDEMEQATAVGLVKGHAYGITAVKRVALEGTGIFNIFNKEKIDMVRLRNPWGGHEWNGAFSDGSEEWNKIDKNSRDKIGLTFDDDGEFWMTFDDYVKHFTNMSICRVVNTSLFSLRKSWSEEVFHGEWKAPHRSGGCVNNKETFLNNPQYLFTISEKEGDEVLFDLTQKSGRGDTSETAKTTIGFSILKVEDNRKYRLHTLQEIVKNSTFKNSRGIFVRHTLPRGRYVLVATTFEAGVNGTHLLRIYTSSNCHAKELTLDKPSPNMFSKICCCFPCCRYPVMVCKITILRAVGLERQDTVGALKKLSSWIFFGADPYAMIYCERDEFRTETCKDTVNPEWNQSAIFFRRMPDSKPFRIELWNSNIVKDTCMGQHTFSGTQDMTEKTMEVDLFDKKKQSEKRPGKLFIKLTMSRNLQAI